MALARRARVYMTYNGRDAAQMAEYITSFKYTDVASGSSDSISVDLDDRDRHWIGGWFPQKGDRLQPVIVLQDWEADGENIEINCGSFDIDDFSFKGGPIRCTIDGLALPSTSGFKTTERTNTYENTTLKEIGMEVAKRAGLSLFYEADTVGVENVSQDNQTDCSFYSELVTKYGLAMKIYNDRLVVFNEADYEAKDPVATLTEADFDPGWSWDTALIGTYTGVKYQYKHTEKDRTFTVEIGGGDRILTCSDAANNQTEATLIALAKLNNANKGTTTMKVTLKATRRIIATNCVQISGLGQLDGKYFVEQAETSVSDGTKLSLELRRVEGRFTKDGKFTGKTNTSGTNILGRASTSISSTTPEQKTAEAAKQFKKGDKVRVTKGAKTYDGVSLAAFVYTTVYTVIQVGGKNLPNDRIVIGKGSEVTAAVKAEDLYMA